MNTLALSDEILLTIDKPARYIGNELNMVKKNPKDVDIRFAIDRKSTRLNSSHSH